MGECKLDHTKDDVREKYQSQVEFLPTELKTLFEKFFDHDHSQAILNDVFHLLKKYDLASEEEKEQRNHRLRMVLENL